MILITDRLSNDSIAKTQIENLEKEKVEYKLIGQMRRVRGHTLFSFNRVTGEIKPATLVKEVLVGIDGKPAFNTKTVVEKDCYYEQALNKKNFIKRLKRRGLL